MRIPGLQGPLELKVGASYVVSPVRLFTVSQVAAFRGGIHCFVDRRLSLEITSQPATLVLILAYQRGWCVMQSVCIYSIRANEG